MVSIVLVMVMVSVIVAVTVIVGDSSRTCICYGLQTRVQVVSKEQREERAAEMAAEMGEKPAEEMRPRFGGSGC